MKRLASILIVHLCFLLSVTAQKDTSFRLHHIVKIAAADLAADNLDNLYVLTTTGQLRKFNASGDSVGVYNDVKRFGRVYSLDVSNPLRLVLFYKDYSTVVLLDRYLSSTTSLDLRRSGMSQVSAAANSYDNNIWVFDAVENKLKKVDESGRVLMQTSDLRQVLGFSFNPEKIIDEDKQVYLFDSHYGVIAFDYYGTLQKKYPLTNWTYFQVFGKRLLGITNNTITLFNTSTQMEKQYQFPSSFGSFNRYLIGNTKLFAVSKDAITVYYTGF